MKGKHESFSKFNNYFTTNTETANMKMLKSTLFLSSVWPIYDFPDDGPKTETC